MRSLAYVLGHSRCLIHFCFLTLFLSLQYVLGPQRKVQFTFPTKYLICSPLMSWLIRFCLEYSSLSFTYSSVVTLTEMGKILKKKNSRPCFLYRKSPKPFDFERYLFNLCLSYPPSSVFYLSL